MSMSNYLSGEAEHQRVMATKQPTGMDHLTVVPTNFEPDIDDSAEEGGTASKQ